MSRQSTPSSSDPKEEVYYFTKDKAPYKIPKSDWCSDSRCTKHITDEPNLFRGIVVPIPRYTVKVRGGKLYIDFIGQAEMKVVGVLILLDNILYVPSLGVNLLSSQKLYID